MMTDKSKFLEAADAIGARLCRDALWAGDRCNWLGDSMEFVESRWQVVRKTFGPDLYGGTSGIALFLAYLFHCTQEKIFKKTAVAAARCALAQLEAFPVQANFGFYSGSAGIAYALIEIGKLLNVDQFIPTSSRLLQAIPCQDIAQSWDVVSGSAGVIPALLKLHSGWDEDFLLETALRHGDMLLKGANRSDEGWSWRTIQESGQKDLTGFSHGTAGIAWAFLELHKKFQEQRFFDAAQQALHYERRWYNSQQENWPDFRSAPASYGVAWCHGAPGIGLSRVRAYQMSHDMTCKAEAEVAVRTTTRSLKAAMQNGGGYSLCHGSAGNAELLVYAGEALGDESCAQTAVQVAEDGLERYHLRRNPWPCGVLNGGETPNLMLGLSGIGYFYLRLYAPKIVPSILMVCPN
jgi:class II lanthipeptide synthase